MTICKWIENNKQDFNFTKKLKFYNLFIIWYHLMKYQDIWQVLWRLISRLNTYDIRLTMRPFYTDAASTSIDLVPTCLLPKAAGICVMNRQALYTCLVCIQYDYCCFVDFEVMIAILTIFHFLWQFCLPESHVTYIQSLFKI